MKRLLIGTVTTLSLLGVTACGSDEPEMFVPASFQASDGRCYYIDDEGEVEQLKNDGLCPRAAAPVQAADDSDFMFLYFPFLSSPSYRDHYVPAHKRSSLQSRLAGVSQRHGPRIAERSKQATYLSSKTGKPVPASRVAPGQFGNGNKGFGNGSKVGCLSLGSTVDLGPVDLVSSSTVVLARGSSSSSGGGGGGRVSSGGGGGGAARNGGTAPKPNSGSGGSPPKATKPC